MRRFRSRRRPSRGMRRGRGRRSSMRRRRVGPKRIGYRI
ncbi:hypothetical protein [robinz microvirus RP_45]|nr:hypothetical protein [robinz microvirus RP_45]